MMVNWDQWNSGRIPAAKSGIPATKPAIPCAKSGLASSSESAYAITVDGEATKSANDALKDVSDDMKAPAKDIRNQMETISGFEGGCFIALSRAFDEGSTNLTTLSDQMVQHGKKVDAAVEGLVATDAQLAKGIEAK